MFSLPCKTALLSLVLVAALQACDNPHDIRSMRQLSFPLNRQGIIDENLARLAQAHDQAVSQTADNDVPYLATLPDQELSVQKILLPSYLLRKAHAMGCYGYDVDQICHLISPHKNFVIIAMRTMQESTTCHDRIYLGHIILTKLIGYASSTDHSFGVDGFAIRPFNQHIPLSIKNVSFTTHDKEAFITVEPENPASPITHFSLDGKRWKAG